MLVNIAKLLFTTPDPHPTKKKRNGELYKKQTNKKKRQYESFLRCFGKGKVHRKSPRENVTLFIFLLDTQPVGWAGLCVYRKWPRSELGAEQVKCGWIIDPPWESDPLRSSLLYYFASRNRAPPQAFNSRSNHSGHLSNTPRAAPAQSGLRCWHR